MFGLSSLNDRLELSDYFPSAANAGGAAYIPYLFTKEQHTVLLDVVWKCEPLAIGLSRLSYPT